VRETDRDRERERQRKREKEREGKRERERDSEIKRGGRRGVARKDKLGGKKKVRATHVLQRIPPSLSLSHSLFLSALGSWPKEVYLLRNLFVSGTSINVFGVSAVCICLWV